jgi:hypothetical protein
MGGSFRVKKITVWIYKYYKTTNYQYKVGSFFITINKTN